MMQVGIHAFGKNAATAEGVARAGAVGAEGVCLGVSAVAGYAEEGVPPRVALRDAVNRYHDAGIAVPAGYADRFSNPLMLNDPSRAAEYQRLLANLERMAAVGIRSVLFYVTPERPADPLSEERAFDDFVAFCDRLGADAAAIGINIACHPWVSRPELLHGYRRLEEMCRRVPHSEMGITYCPGGALAGDDLHAVRDRLRDRLHFAHLRDQIGLWDSFEEVFPGTGDVGIPALIQQLRDCGYQGLLCPEHLGPEPPGRDLEAEAVAYAKELIRG
jgi:sugar phosphate isomerase/epimerase